MDPELRDGDPMSAWSGDLASLGRIAENLRALVDVPSRASREAARKIKRLIDREFRTGSDPYGEPWEPLAAATIEKKGGDDRILIDSGDMRRGIHVRPMARAGISVTSDAEYLGFHQGAGAPRANVPPRHVLPEGEMPPEWEDAIDESLEDAFRRALA